MNAFARIPRRTRLALIAGAATLFVAASALAAITLIRRDGASDYIGLAGGPANVVYRKLNTPAGETTGAWHYHPGYVYNVVESGSITVEDGCGEIRTYSAGQSFETSEGRVHRAYNLGAEDAIEHNMFINPPGRPLGVNIPGDVRLCGPVSTVDECMAGGWQTFNHPYAFANQGACIAYVNSRPTRTVLIPEDPLP